jgi:NAD(P)H dehydrogenase (quinone)
LSTFLPFIAWHVPDVTTDTREACLNEYRKYLAAIETAVPMSFPSLDDYDDRFFFPKKSIAGRGLKP